MRKVEKRLREKLKEFEKEIIDLRLDRSKFREHWVTNFKWFIELHGNNKVPNMNYLIEQEAKFLTRVERWWW